MVDALGRSARRDPRDRRRQDAPTIGFAIDALSSSFREGLSVVHLTLVPATVGAVTGLITVSLIGGFWTTLVLAITIAAYWYASRPLIREHEQRQRAFFSEALRNHGVLVNTLELWRETSVFKADHYVQDRYRKDRSAVETAARRSYHATRRLQLAQSGVLAGGIACALLVVVLRGTVTHAGTIIAVAGVFISASLPLQAAGFGVSTLAVASARRREADEQVGFEFASGKDERKDAPPPFTGRPVWCLGASGAGKTTWGERMLGLREYHDGQLGPHREGAAYLPQDPRLLSVTTRENVDFGRSLSDEAIDSALVAVGLAQFASGGDRAEEIISPETTSLSGGELRRVALARALVDRGTSIVLLDEPTGGLDDSKRSAVWRLIEAHAMERLVIVATHDPHAPIRTGDLILRPDASAEDVRWFPAQEDGMPLELQGELPS